MYTEIICWIACGLAANSWLSRRNAGNKVSIENGPSIASPASSGASRRGSARKRFIAAGADGALPPRSLRGRGRLRELGSAEQTADARGDVLFDLAHRHRDGVGKGHRIRAAVALDDGALQAEQAGAVVAARIHAPDRKS